MRKAPSRKSEHFAFHCQSKAAAWAFTREHHHCSFPGSHWVSLTEVERGVTLMRKRVPPPRECSEAAEPRQNVCVHAWTVLQCEDAHFWTDCLWKIAPVMNYNHLFICIFWHLYRNGQPWLVESLRKCFVVISCNRNVEKMKNLNSWTWTQIFDVHKE